MLITMAKEWNVCLRDEDIRDLIEYYKPFNTIRWIEADFENAYQTMPKFESDAQETDYWYLWLYMVLDLAPFDFYLTRAGVYDAIIIQMLEDKE